MIRYGFMLGVASLVALAGCSDALGIHELSEERLNYRVEQQAHGETSIVLVQNGNERVLDTVGGTVAATGETDVAGRIDLRYFDRSVISWFWYEARTQSSTTGGTRFAIHSGDIRNDEAVEVVDYGQIYDIIDAVRVDEARVVVIAFSDHGPNDFRDSNGNISVVPNIRVLDVVVGEGIVQDIPVEGIMADELLDVTYAPASNTAYVVHSYHGDIDDSVVQL